MGALTDALKAGPFQRGAATHVETDHKQAVVGQNHLRHAVAHPLFLHGEVDLRGTKQKGKTCTFLIQRPKLQLTISRAEQFLSCTNLTPQHARLDDALPSATDFCAVQQVAHG